MSALFFQRDEDPAVERRRSMRHTDDLAAGSWVDCSLPADTAKPAVELRGCRTVTVQVTGHAGLGHRGPITHFDPPSSLHVLRLLLVELRRRAIDLCLSREPDGRLALRAGVAEAHAPLAYIDGLSTADAVLALAELAGR